MPWPSSSSSHHTVSWFLFTAKLLQLSKLCSMHLFWVFLEPTSIRHFALSSAHCHRKLHLMKSISTRLRGGSTSQLTYVNLLHWALGLQAPLVCLFFTGHSFSLAESDLFMLKCYHKQKTQKFISSSELASALSCLNLHIQMLLSTRHLTVQAKHTRHWNVPTSASSTGVSSPLQFYLVTQTKDPRVNAKCSSAGSLLKK